jgi:hypothetical protein
VGGVAGVLPRRGGSVIKILASPIFLWSEGETSPLRICFDFDVDFDFDFDFILF